MLYFRLKYNIYTCKGINTPLGRLIKFEFGGQEASLLLAGCLGSATPGKEAFHEFGEGAVSNGRADTTHHVEQVGQIVQTNIGGCIWLAGAEGRVKPRARHLTGTRRAGTTLFDWTEIIRVVRETKIHLHKRLLEARCNAATLIYPAP